MAQNHQLTERESFFSCCTDQPGSNFSDQKRCEARTTVHSAWPSTRGCAKCPKMEVSLQAAVSFLQETDDRGALDELFSTRQFKTATSTTSLFLSSPIFLASVARDGVNTSHSRLETDIWRQVAVCRYVVPRPLSRPCLRLSWRKPGVFLTPPQPLLWLTFPFSSSLKTQSAHHGVCPDPPGVGTAAKRAGQEQ